MKLGVLTGGGDSSAINAFLYFLAQRSGKDAHSLVGFRNGWKGLVCGDFTEITKLDLENSRFSPGTVLGTSRTNPIKDNTVDVVLENLEKHKIDALVSIGGDDTLSVAAHLAKCGVKIIGVPQTIDNDVEGTDRCLGFATSLGRAAADINSITNSNVAHDRDMIVEVMGRDSGWIALETAINTSACACMCPEGMMDLDETIAAMRSYRKATGRASLAIVAEGIQVDGDSRNAKHVDAFNNTALEGVGHVVGARYEEVTGRKPRVQVLGYLLRGGTPVPADIELAAIFANKAVDLIEMNQTGQMVAVRDNKPSSIALANVVGIRRKVPQERLEQYIRLLA